MRIGFLGDGEWARRALDLIIDDDDLSLAFVVPRYPSPDENLCLRAERAGVDVLRPANVNAADSVDRLAAYHADVLVSMSFDQVIKADLLSMCPLGAVNCHAGALPFYRGRNVLSWALINDEPEFGITVHYMDEGIDTGDIILQRRSPITDKDTYATLLQRASLLCAETLHEALRLLAQGRAPRTRQDTIHPVGFYTGIRDDEDGWLDWSQPSRRVFNFVRATTTPGPCARSLLDGVEEVRIVSVALVPEAPHYLGTPGAVVGRDERGAHVKTGDTTVLVTELSRTSGRPLRIGQRFLSPIAGRLHQLELRLAELSEELGLPPI